MMQLEALKWVKPWVIIITTVIIQNPSLHLYSSLFFPNNSTYLLSFASHDVTVPILRGRAEPQGDNNLAYNTSLTKHKPGFKCRFHNFTSNILPTSTILK